MSKTPSTEFIVHYEVSVEPEEVPWLLQGAVAESDGMVSLGFRETLSKELCGRGLAAEALALRALEGLHLMDAPEPKVMQESSEERMKSWVMTEAYARHLSGEIETDTSDAEGNQSDTTDQWDLSNFTDYGAVPLHSGWRDLLAGEPGRSPCLGGQLRRGAERDQCLALSFRATS